ncbi:MAG: O-antigen ligase family protein [Synergistaceae bacterium]|jgi:hypothetical protein|nr:O-antigen ligase family protein [Synergistaceae bacterium]
MYTRYNSNKDKILWLFFFLMGIVWIFKAAYFDLIFYAFFLERIIYLIINRKKILFKGSHYIAIAISLFLIIHSMCHNLDELLNFTYIPFSPAYSLYRNLVFISRSVMIPIALLIFTNDFLTYHKDVFLVKAFIGGGMCIIILLMFCYLSNFAITRYLGRISILGVGPGVLALSMVTYIYCLLIVIINTHRVFTKLILSCGIAIASFLMFFTFSRAAILAFLIGIILAPFSGNQRKGLYIIILIGAGSLLFHIYMNHRMSSILGRLTLTEMLSEEGTGRGRLNQWRDYLNHATWKDYTLGRGFNYEATQSILYQKSLTTLDMNSTSSARTAFRIFYPHNQYLFILLGLGIGGLVLYLLFLFMLLMYTFYGIRAGTIHWIYLSILISWIVRTLFEVDITKLHFTLSASLVWSQVIKYRLHNKKNIF